MLRASNAVPDYLRKASRLRIMAIPIGVDPGSVSQSSNIPSASTAASSIPINPSITGPVRDSQLGPSPGIAGFDFDDTTTEALVIEVPRDNVPAGPVTSPSVTDREGSGPSSTTSTKEREEELKHDTSRRRQEWNEDRFNGRPGYVTAATEKIMSEAPVIADLRTNVIVGAKQQRLKK
jgi:hypothetical protein